MLLVQALAPSGLAISTAPAVDAPVRARDLLRADVLSLLPKGGGAPAIASGALLAAVEELELQGVTPASPEFLSLALGAGAWELRAIGPADGAAAPSASELVQINGVECRVDGERIRTSTSFALADEELVGSLEASAAWSSTTRADTLHLVADGLELSMPRAPSRSSGTFGKSQSSMTSQPPKFAPVAQELRFMRSRWRGGGRRARCRRSRGRVEL